MAIKDAWRIFCECFKEGDEVFVVSDDDEVFWGRLGPLEEQDSDFVLHRPGGIKHSIPWMATRWVSHDGFPVRKLLGADGSASIEKDISQGVNQNLLEAIRTAAPRIKRARFGDPFEFENVISSELHNAGLTGLQHFCKATEETLVLTAKCGAQAVLYDLPSLFAAEFVPST